MDELIIRALQGQASTAEQQRLKAWRRQDPANERQYGELHSLWIATGAGFPQLAVSPPPAAAAIIAQAQSETTPARSHDAAPRSLRMLARSRGGGRASAWMRAAVLAAACMALGFGLATLVDGRATVEPLLAHSEIATGAGEMTTISLGDGSSIRLGPRSRIRLGMEGETRVAHLEGRAFFGVQSDRSRRFVVRTRYGEAVVLGTRFEVRSEAEEFRVLVLEGRVHVNSAGRQADLEPGEMSRRPQGGQLTSARVDDVLAHLDWMGNALVFQRTSLGEVIREIEHRYGTSIVLADPELTDMTVTATFTDQPLQDVVRVVCETLRARCETTDGVVTIGRTTARD